MQEQTIEAQNNEQVGVDRGFCVYAEIDSTGEVFYIAEGRDKVRIRNNSTRHGRSKAWIERSKGGYTIEILKKGLTKDEALRIKQEIIAEFKAKGINLANTVDNKNPKDYTADYFSQYFAVDPEAKYGIVWNCYNKIGRKVWPGKEAGVVSTKTGYILLSLKGKTYAVHRIIYALAHGVCPHDLQVNHIDGNKQNNKIENLELVTSKENVKHAREMGLIKPMIGEENPTAELTEEKVYEIYKLLEKGLSNEAVADLVGIEWKHVSLLRNGKRWKHLYEKYGKKFPKSAKPMKIQDDQILQALRMFEEGYNNLQISQATGIERSQVSRLRHGKTLQSRVEFLKSQQEKQPDLLAA